MLPGKEKKDPVKIEMAWCHHGIAASYFELEKIQESYVASKKGLKLLHSLRKYDPSEITDFGLIVNTFSSCCVLLKKYKKSIMSLMYYLKKMSEVSHASVDSHRCLFLFQFQKLGMISTIAQNLYDIGRVNDSMRLKELVLVKEEDVSRKLKILNELIFHFSLRIPCKKKFLQFYRMIPQETEDDNEEIKETRKIANLLFNHFDGPRFLPKGENVKLFKDFLRRKKKKTPHSCNYFLCNAEKRNLMKCSGCRIFYYCSARCQKKDWTDHKKYCCDLVKI